jgi:hypothetical protein
MPRRSAIASPAEIMAVLFFDVMRYDVQAPRAPRNDVFVLSKGHAAPILYAAWAEAGAFPRGHLLTLRQLDSDLEGHPTPRLPFVDVATGSLGQGLSAGIGLALDAGPVPLDVARVLEALRPQQGMLYYHLLLARLEARGEVGCASVPREPLHR